MATSVLKGIYMTTMVTLTKAGTKSSNQQPCPTPPLILEKATNMSFCGRRKYSYFPTACPFSSNFCKAGGRFCRNTRSTYCWWFKNHAPVEVGSLSHYLQGFSTIPGGCLEFLPSTHMFLCSLVPFFRQKITWWHSCRMVRDSPLTAERALAALPIFKGCREARS